MDYTTEKEKKSIIREQLAIMTGVVKSLEAAGVNIIQAQAGSDGDSCVLFSRSCDAFRAWAAENELDVIFTPIESDFHQWRIGTTVNGINVHSYMSDRQKEEYDNATV